MKADTSVQRQPTAVQLRLARFLRDVVREARVWAIFHRGEPIVIHAPNENILLLWSSRKAALFNQRRGWPQLAIGSVSLCELLTHFLPGSHEHGIVVGIGASEKGEDVVTIPADWLERGLRAGVETGWRPELD